MKCPRLKKDVIYTCECGGESVIPGSPALRKFCKSNYENCERFKVHAKTSAVYAGLAAAA